MSFFGKLFSKDVGSNWALDRYSLVRVYKFPDALTGEDTSLDVVCSISKYASGFIDPKVRFQLRPCSCLQDKPFENSLKPSPFLVGLIAGGSGAGTESDPLVRGGLYQVNTHGHAEEPGVVSLNVKRDEDVAQCLKAIASGDDLTFSVLDYGSSPPVRIRLRLPNDGEFRRKFIDLRKSVEQLPYGT
jgi:hypothetical protein